MKNISNKQTNSTVASTRLITPKMTPAKNVFSTPSDHSKHSYDLTGSIDNQRRSEHLDISTTLHITPPNNNSVYSNNMSTHSKIPKIGEGDNKELQVLQSGIGMTQSTPFLGKPYSIQKDSSKSYQLESLVGLHTSMFEPRQRQYKLRTDVKLNYSVGKNPSTIQNDFTFTSKVASLGGTPLFQRKNEYQSQSMRNNTFSSNHKPFISSGNLGIQTTPVNNRLAQHTEELQKDKYLLNNTQLNGNNSTYLTGIESYSSSKQLPSKATNFGMFGKNHIRLESLKTQAAEVEEDRACLEELRLMSPLPRSRKDFESKSVSFAQLQLPSSSMTSFQPSAIRNIEETDNSNEESHQFSSSNISSTSVIGRKKFQKIKSSSTLLIDGSPNGLSHSEGAEKATAVAEASLKTFNQDYKHISQILQESQLFNDPMDVQELMLTSTISKNVLPRKLGIIQGGIAPNYKSITQALKKHQKIINCSTQRSSPRSMDTTSTLFHNSFKHHEDNSLHISSSLNHEDSQLLPAGLSLSPKKSSQGKSIGFNLNNQITSNSSPALGLAQTKNTSSSPVTSIANTPSIQKQNSDQGTVTSSTSIQSPNNNFKPASIMKRNNNNMFNKTNYLSNSSSRQLSQPISGSRTIQIGIENGLTEQDNKKPLDRVTFKDSNDVAMYLQKNYLAKDEEDFIDESIPLEPKQKLNLQRLQISKTYAEMLASALQHSDFENLNSLNLLDNNLTGESIALLADNLPVHIKKIDLSSNFLNSQDANALVKIFNNKKYDSLVQLNLSNNQIGDLGLKIIAQPLSVNSKLVILNLSHNKLTDFSMPILRDILLRNCALMELYLGWNKIGSKGGVEIAAGLANSFVLKVLDLSHNSLGQNANLKSGVKIIESCTKIESGVIHLDLSYNLFQPSECVQIAAALAKNKKIYGFHFEGNESEAIIDSRGHVFFPEEDQILQKHIATHSLMRRDIKSVKCLGFNKLQNFSCNVTDNCWICDGWQEIEFAVGEGCNEAFSGEPAFLHLDFEDFKPTNMERDPADPTRFVLRRMCPPNRRIHFFFTNPCTKILFESNDYEKITFHSDSGLHFYEGDIFEECAVGGNVGTQESGLSKDKNQQQVGSSGGGVVIPDESSHSPNSKLKAIKNNQHYLMQSRQRRFNVKYLDGTVQEYIVPTTVNYVDTRLHQNIVKKKGEYEVQVKCLPRQDELFFKINFTNLWHREISLFKNFVADTIELEKKCLDEDWQNSKISQVLIGNDKQSDIEECKQIIMDKFPQIRVLYRYLSCFGLLNDVFCITIHPFSLFASQSKIADGKLLKMNDLHCLFVAASTKALKVKNMRAPEKALTRSEFLEVMGRIAIDKYMRNKIAKTTSEALSMLFNEPAFVSHIAEYEDPQKWRNIRYWTQQCDEMMKRYLNFLKSLWNEYADSRKMEKFGVNTSQKTMGLIEFRDMANDFNLKDTNLTEREVIMSFNLALMTEIDEITSDRYMVLSFVEFLESIARLAEFKSRTPVGEREESYIPGETLEIRLEYKIESLLELMSISFESVIKERKRRQMLMQKQLQRSSSRIGSLKVRKTFLQFSLSEIDEQEKTENAPNKFASIVKNIMTSLKGKAANASEEEKESPTISSINQNERLETLQEEERSPDKKTNSKNLDNSELKLQLKKVKKLAANNDPPSLLNIKDIAD